MAILEIKKYPEPTLRKKSEEVKEITQEIKKLCQDMVETLKTVKGTGLAAGQVGELKRIIAVQTEKTPVVFINPKIIKKSKKTEVTEEGCLSFPGLWLKIKRSKEVAVETLDIKGKEIKVNAAGISARVLQHEIDHLDGILIIDRIPFWQRLKLKLKLKKN